MDDILPSLNTSKDFRLQNKRIHLTYKTHIPPKAWLSWFKNIKNKELEKYSIVHEKGNSVTAYDHTHILLDFGYALQTRNSRFFDWEIQGETIHPHIKIIKTELHWKRTLLYHYKENEPFTNIEKPEAQDGPIKEIWKHDTLKDALLSTCSTLKNVGGVIAAFNCKPSDYGMEPDVQWKPWQQELLDEVKTKPDSRHVLWYYDPFGNSGKSFIAKHMGMYRGAFVSTKANTYHVATSIDEFLKQNGSNSILVVIFNFTRQQACHKIYQALEELKDGMITSEKYKGRTMYFPHPHLVCMANYIPDIETMTPDRWDIRTLQNDKVVKRYVGGQIVFEAPEIDPYIAESLKEIDSKYANMKDQYGRPLNIKGTGNLAALGTPAPRETLASLDKPAAQAPAPRETASRQELPPLGAVAPLQAPRATLNKASPPVKITCLPPLIRLDTGFQLPKV